MGINEVHDDIWVVGLMKYDLAYFDLETRVLEPLNNPFEPKVLPMCAVRSVTYVSGPDPQRSGAPGGDNLRTFLAYFVAGLPHIEVPSELRL